MAVAVVVAVVVAPDAARAGSESLVHARKPVAYGRDRGASERAAAPAVRAAYPKVSQLRLQFAFDKEDGPAPSEQVHILHPAARAYFRFPCPTSGCSGEFDLGPAIEKMAGSRQKHVADFLDCEGIRAEHRVSGVRCALHLRYTVDISYA